MNIPTVRLPRGCWRRHWNPWGRHWTWGPIRLSFHDLTAMLLPYAFHNGTTNNPTSATRMVVLDDISSSGWVSQLFSHLHEIGQSTSTAQTDSISHEPEGWRSLCDVKWYSVLSFFGKFSQVNWSKAGSPWGPKSWSKNWEKSPIVLGKKEIRIIDRIRNRYK